MHGIAGIFLIFAIIQAVSSQLPEKCVTPPAGLENPGDCCNIPLMFSEEVGKECNIENPKNPVKFKEFVADVKSIVRGKDQEAIGNKIALTFALRMKSMGAAIKCTKAKCLLNKINLLKEDETTDTDGIAVYLDKWADTNPEFKDAVGKAKSRCLTGELPGPPEICEPSRVAFCIRATLFDECPNWVENDSCTKLKDHINECKSYLPF